MTTISSYHAPYLHPVPTRPWPLLLSFLLLHATCLAQPLPADSLVAPNAALHLRLWLDSAGAGQVAQGCPPTR
jgi:hypothetical protein